MKSLNSKFVFGIALAIAGPRNFSSVKVSKAEFEGGGWLVV